MNGCLARQDPASASWLNIVPLAVLLVTRFFRTGGRGMLSMMGGSPDEEHAEH